MAIDITEAQMDRVARAINEGSGWEILETETNFHVLSGSRSYVVSPYGCSCPDHQYRCAGTEMRCKHRIAVNRRLFEAGRDPAAVFLAKRFASEALAREACALRGDEENGEPI